MRIYFTASTAGKKKCRTRYEKIVKILEEMGHRVIMTFLTAEEQKSFLKKSAQEIYEETKKQLEEADVVVAELGDYSFGSFGVGWRVNYALSIQKPVLCIYPEGYDTYYISPLLKGSTSEFLTLRSYKIRSLKKMFEKYFSKISGKRGTRLNFITTPLIDDYLDWVAFHRKIPKSKTLRDLVYQAIEKDDEFHKNKNSFLKDNSK